MLSDKYIYMEIISGNKIKAPFRIINRFLKKKRYKEFIKRRISFSESVYDDNSIKDADIQYDLFIVGSDQVWNPDLSGGDMNYLLRFANPVKRNSYAASIGQTNLPSMYRESFPPILNSFNNISVRENMAAALLKDIGVDKHINVDVDPTMLLSEAEWNMVAGNRYDKKKYIFVYMVNCAESLLNNACDFARNNGCDVVYVGPYIRKTGIRYFPNPQVERILVFFRNAEFVFTNSFHGTAFSILYRKQFLIDAPYSDGRNERLYNLLALCGLTERTIASADRMAEVIDWAAVDAIVEKEREKSCKYIEKIVAR